MIEAEGSRHSPMNQKNKSSSSLVRIPTLPLASLLTVENAIVIVRQRRVILDFDLARLYGVPVRQLNQQLKRNQERFPSDFVFQLSAKESEDLRSQSVISSERHGGRRYLPNAFTEHGAIMAATVLNSTRAVDMSVFVVRAFVRLRDMVAGNRKLAAKIYELESRMDKNDFVTRELLKTIKAMMMPQKFKRRQLGFELPASANKPGVSRSKDGAKAKSKLFRSAALAAS
jgi:hypothetical protein